MKISKFPKMLHGGDYNPEQWLNYPDILKKDIELFKMANINVVSLGIFGWSTLEPEEGVYNLDWLGNIIDNLYANGIYTVLATPTAARPVWMSQKYPEVLRVEKNRVRNLQGGRHNHCYTSPIYREKTKQINTLLAQRFAKHPAVIMWHISNELSGECHCELCQEAFRTWLKEKYKTLDELNHAWWTHFWSHTYTDWDQIESPAWHGEMDVHGLNLDWRRFVTHQTIEFLRLEVKPLKDVAPEIPVTINMMGLYTGLNYFKFKNEIDIVSWDCYSEWHKPSENNAQEYVACMDGFAHDLMRSVKGESFILMESTPCTTNWREYSKLKKPGMHMLASLAAVSHGSDSVMYFQLRQSRGSCEKFHSAVISHNGTENTRIFKEVTETGAVLEKLQEIYGTQIDAKVAIIYDIENKWAMEDSKGPRNKGLNYVDTLMKHYKYFWKNGVAVDLVDMECDFSKYTVVIAPMLYMYRAGISDKLKTFTNEGGVLVTTYLSGLVNDTDLCFLGDNPGEGMNEVIGIDVEEIDALYNDDCNYMEYDGNIIKLTQLCEIVKPTTAQVIATYSEDYYKGRPALTENKYGKGHVYYLAARAEDESFYNSFYSKLTEKAGISSALGINLPEGCCITVRGQYYFLQNFNGTEISLDLLKDYKNVINNEIKHNITIEPYSAKVLVNCTLASKVSNQ